MTCLPSTPEARHWFTECSQHVKSWTCQAKKDSNVHQDQINLSELYRMCFWKDSVAVSVCGVGAEMGAYEHATVLTHCVDY